MQQSSIKSNPERSKMSKNLTLTLLAGLLASGPITAAEPLPYGHQDFVPTPERPIGIHGDGNGHFSGATLVSEFWDGRPEWGEVEYRPLKGKEKETKQAEFRYADQVPKNILWKTELPGWTYAQPIPVKGRLYGIGEPDWVWCADQTTGKILWKERLTIASCDPALVGKPDEQKRLQEIYDIGRAACFIDIPFRGWLRVGMQNPAMIPQHPFVNQAIAILEKMKGRMQVLDPDPVLLKAFDDEIAAVKVFQTGGLAAITKDNEAKKPSLDIGPEPCGLAPAAIARKYQVTLKATWWGWCPLAVSVPVSDGERVYVILGTGQVAAYDLDGKRVWSTLRPFFNQIKLYHWPSPIVVGDLLILRKRSKTGYNELTALRAKTGEMVWERSGFSGGSDNGHGSFGAPMHVRAQDANGKVLDAIYWDDQLVNAADGSVISSKLVNPYRGNNLGAALVGRDGKWVAGAGVDGNPPGSWHVIYDGDKPKTEYQFPFDHFNGPHSKGDQSSLSGTTFVLLSDAPVVFSGGSTWDWNTGRVLGQSGKRMFNTTQTVIGRTMLSLPDAGSPSIACGRRRADFSARDVLKTADLSDPRHPRPRSLWNLIGGPELPSDLLFETWLPGTDMLGLWLSHTGQQQWSGGGAFTGLPSWLTGGQCGSLAQGEKTFIQTYKYLICVGPAIKGTATDDPKIVAAIRAETDAAKLEGYLKHASAQYRYEAIQKLKSSSEILKKLATQDPYEEIRAAAFEALERATPGSGKTLFSEQITAFANTKYPWGSPVLPKDSFALSHTCRRLGLTADSVLAEAIDKITEEGPRGQLLTMIESSDTCGPLVEKACITLAGASKPKADVCDNNALIALCILARGGKIRDHAEQAATTLETNLPAWQVNWTVSQWKPFDDIVPLPAVRPRLTTLLGNIITQEKLNPDRTNHAMRRIEELGKDAAALAPKLQAMKEKQKNYALWIDRILAGMGVK